LRSFERAITPEWMAKVKENARKARVLAGSR